MKTQPKVSIIIPFKELDEDVERCVRYCLKIDYKNYDIILLPDKKFKKKFSRSKVIVTGPVCPSVKRNIGIKKSNAYICVFIDADAYPQKKWIKNAILVINENDVGAVGGPILKLPNTSDLEKVSFDIIYSKLGTKAIYFTKRYKHRGTFECTEQPTCNLFVKRDILLKLGGFNENLPIGEDAELCFRIKKLNKKIIYTKRSIVHHYMRPLFIPQMKRIALQATYKAILLKLYPSQIKPIYFLPSIFTIGLFFGFVISFFISFIKYVYISSLIFYFLVVLYVSIKDEKTLKKRMLMFIGIPLIHISYGFGFLRGLFKSIRLYI